MNDSSSANTDSNNTTWMTIGNAIELNEAELGKIAAMIGTSAPFCLINLVKFKAKADYAPQDQTDENRDWTGERAYSQYIQDISGIAGKHDAKAIFSGKISALVIGALGQDAALWDQIVIVRYPSLEALKMISAATEFQTANNVHRKAALEGQLNIAAIDCVVPASVRDGLTAG